MIPMLATIISIYCCLRLLEMGLAAYGRQSQESLKQWRRIWGDSDKVDKPFIDVSWLLYFGGALVIAILCIAVVGNAIKVANDLEVQQVLNAKSAEIHRKANADLQRFNDDIDKQTKDVKRQIYEIIGH